VKDGIKYANLIKQFIIFILLNYSDKVPDFLSLVARMLGMLIYSLVTGFQLTLVFLSVSPVIVLIFHLTIKVRKH